MTPCNEKKFYLNNGKLDLSSLGEDTSSNEKEKPKPQIEDYELVEIQSNNITATLEEMALMFEEDTKEDKNGLEAECQNAFSSDRLKREMKEFGIDK